MLSDRSKYTPMNAAELENHAEFPFITWKLSPTKKGKLPVAVGRGGPFDIAYEVHGNGPIRLVVSSQIYFCVTCNMEYVLMW